MSNRPMFEYIAYKYNLGNFDTPGIFATSGKHHYYKNYERYSTTQSFSKIGWQFLNDIKSGQKAKLSTNTVLDFLTINLWNFEYFMNNKF